LATGGSKAVKELEKEQKTRNTRLVRDSLDGALLDIATVYRDILLVKSGASEIIINRDLKKSHNLEASKISEAAIIKSINLILEARKNLLKNSSSTLMIEALISNLKIPR
jgi:DNA polymerase-3 subunit delta'